MHGAATRWCVDGAPGTTVSLDDRGLLYGDGVFRTVRCSGGRPWRWGAHLETLARDAERIGLGPLPAPETLTEHARLLVADDDGVLRITLTQGGGPRGYGRPAQAASRCILGFTPGALPVFAEGCISLQVARTPLSENPALAGVKHLGRLDAVLASQEPAAAMVEDRLMLDGSGHPVCSTRGNVFFVSGARLCTPALSRCGVAGVVRSGLLDGGLLGDGLGGPAADVREWRLQALLDASELFVTNAVVGLRSVDAVFDVDGRELTRYAEAAVVATRVASVLREDADGAGTGWSIEPRGAAAGRNAP